MSYEFEGKFTPQGWQCPICKRVYSPMTPMCYYCGGKTETWSTSTDPCVVKNVPTYILDWMKDQTIQKMMEKRTTISALTGNVKNGGEVNDSD